jgi:hypothetical protein
MLRAVLLVLTAEKRLYKRLHPRKLWHDHFSTLLADEAGYQKPLRYSLRTYKWALVRFAI